MTMPTVNSQDGSNDHGSFPASTANSDEALHTEGVFSLIDKDDLVN